jgi:hypothetical protein
MGYLDRLAARLVESRPLIRPRPLSRFEAADALTASLPEPGKAGEDDALHAPSLRARPSQAAQARGDESRPPASSMPPVRAGTRASPSEPRRTLVIGETAGAQDASQDGATPAWQDVRTTPREGPAPALAERPASAPAVATAMPAVRTASPPPDAAPVPSPTLPATVPKSRTAAADMAGRIAPWRAPIDAAARSSIDPRMAAPASIAAAAPKHRERAAAADPPAVVQVTIGRLEVRSPEAPARRPVAKPARVAPRMSLQDYLQRRAGGQER